MKEEYVEYAMTCYKCQDPRAVVGLYYKIMENEKPSKDRAEKLLKFVGSIDYSDADATKKAFSDYVI